VGVICDICSDRVGWIPHSTVIGGHFGGGVIAAFYTYM